MSDTVSNSHMLKSIRSKIDANIINYHQHSKTCRQCRHPKGVYESRLPKHQRCPDGTALTSQLMTQLYLRAEHEPAGSFRVSIKEGWNEIFELIEVICHNKQGEYTTKVVDLRRAKPKYATPELAPMMTEARGSDWEEDMRRRGQASRMTPSPQYTNAVPIPVPHGHPGRSSGMLQVYPDPALAYPSPSSSPAGSFVSANSGKSVKFAPRVQVREFED